jgi:hypothetical protein
MKSPRIIAALFAVSCYPYPTGEVAEWCAEHQCYSEELTYSADAAHVGTVKAALEILRAATGADFRMGEFGIPTAFEAGVPSGCEDEESTHNECGCVLMRWLIKSNEKLSQEIYVSSDLGRCGDPVRILVHEIIHTFLPPNAGHAKAGVFSEHAGQDMRLYGESLDILCAAMADGCPLRRDELPAEVAAK